MTADPTLLRAVVARVASVIPYSAIQTYPRPDHPIEARRGTSFQVLIQIIISQRTTLERELLAAQRLFRVYRTPESLANAAETDIAELIRPAGMYRAKAAGIVAVSRAILDRYEGDIDRLRELPLLEARQELLSLPHVGPKTADCMLELGFDAPILPVDVNVYRVSQRLRIVPEGADKETVSKTIAALLPNEVEAFREAHTYLLALGKYFCRARPLCSRCPVQDLCPSTRGGADWTEVWGG